MALVINLFINELEGNAKDVPSEQQIFYDWFPFRVHLSMDFFIYIKKSMICVTSKEQLIRQEKLKS